MERSSLYNQNGDGELMATYSTIKGFNIQSLASDPYATVAASGTWASGTTMNTARYYCAGTATATATDTQICRVTKRLGPQPPPPPRQGGEPVLY